LSNSNFVTFLEGKAAMKRTGHYPCMPKTMEWVVTNASRCYGTLCNYRTVPCQHYHISSENQTATKG